MIAHPAIDLMIAASRLSNQGRRKEFGVLQINLLPNDTVRSTRPNDSIRSEELQQEL
jgi:hypothetical protein